MTIPLLTTKLHIPSFRPNLVPRPRLIERLNAGLNRKLTLISAPAGFGKTTLVGEWVNDLRARGRRQDHIINRIAWLSLDKNDNDCVRFLVYVIAALRTIESRGESVHNLGKGALQLLQSPQPPPLEAVLTSLLNEISAHPDKVVLVLDDYHLIEVPPIHDALTFMFSHLPQQLHVVIATRDDPPLPLARLRASDQMTELRASDLRFSSSEAAEFLNQSMGLGLSAEDIKILDTRTEGWIAGLQLAAISIQGRKDAAGLIKSFAGSHRFVLDYLIEEVLEQQSESVQTFLLQTAVLDRLNSSLCDLVTGRDNSQRMLEKLEHANLFILPMDEERRWYRYHQLFADLLRHRLKQKYPEKFPILHSRASMWYEQNGFIDEAIEHALRAEEFERTASLVEEHVNAVWESGEHIKLRRWLACLPDETVFCKPHLCIIRAWDLFTSGKHTAAERSLQAAEQAIDAKADRRNENSSIEQDRAYSSDEMNVHGRIAAIRAYLSLYRGDVAGTIHFACLALEHLPEQDSNWRITANIALGDAYSIRGEMTAAYRARKSALEASKSGGNLYMIASLKLADTSRQQGQLRRCAEICEQQLEFAQENGMSQTMVAGWLSAIWGETLAELNEPDRALQHASNGVKLTERGEDVMVIGWSNLCLLRVLFSRGDMAGAERIIQKMENIARKHDVPRFISNQVTAWQVRILLAQNQLTAAYRCLQDSGLDIDAVGTRFREVGYIALARTLIADGRSDESAVLLQRLFEETETSEHTSRLIEILML